MRRAGLKTQFRDGTHTPWALARKPGATPGANGLSNWLASVAQEHIKLAEGLRNSLTPGREHEVPSPVPSPAPAFQVIGLDSQSLSDYQDDDLSGVWAPQKCAHEFADYSPAVDKAVLLAVRGTPSPRPGKAAATVLLTASHSDSSSSSPSPRPSLTSLQAPTASPVLHPPNLPHHPNGETSPEYGEPGDFPDGYLEEPHPADLAAAKKRRNGTSVKPHSGLEAQDAADYEARLAAGEARESLTAANRSGQSSDDEDAGGSTELSRAIAQSTQRAKEQQAKRKQRQRSQSDSDVSPTPDASRSVPSEAQTLPVTGHALSSSNGVPAPEQPSSGDASALGAAFLAAQLLAAASLGGDADAFGLDSLPTLGTALFTAPNRFLGVPEPPTLDGLCLAIAVLNRQQQAQQMQAAAQRAAANLTWLIDHTEVQPTEDLYRHSRVLELALGLPLLEPAAAPSADLACPVQPDEGVQVQEEEVQLRQVLGVPVGPPVVDPHAVVQLLHRSQPLEAC